MSPLVDLLNRGGTWAMTFATSFAWQISLLVVAVLVLDALLRRRARAILRYALWSLVLVKLILPPSLAFPTGLAYWVGRAAPATRAIRPPLRVTLVSFPETAPTPTPALPAPPSAPRLGRDGTLLLIWISGAALLLGLLIHRSGQVARLVRVATPANDQCRALLDDCRRRLGLRRALRLKLSSTAVSPAVCGWRTPVIVLPSTLAEHLRRDQLRSVLFHELIHVRRGDVFVNCLQALLQVVYWWHPLVWVANARIRRVREEAVDEAVMVALGVDADLYPATLIEVARWVLARPGIALGLVGIFESKGALRQRIRRLIERPVPHGAKLNTAGIVAVAACGALLLPMARGHRAEAPMESTSSSAASTPGPSVLLNCTILEVTDAAWGTGPLGPPSSVGTNGHEVWVSPPDRMASLSSLTSSQSGIFVVARPRLVAASGVTGTVSVTRATNLDGRTVQLGTTCELTPRLEGGKVDLALKASLTELARVTGDDRTFAANATGYVTRDVAEARATVPEQGGLVVHNPAIRTREGRHLVFVVLPVIVQAGDMTGARPDASSVNGESPMPWRLEVRAEEPHYSLDGRAMSPEELRQELKERLSRQPQAVLMIRAASDVPLISLRQALDVAQEAGVSRVSLQNPAAKNSAAGVREDGRVLGFDWFLGNTLMTSSNAGQPVAGVAASRPAPALESRVFRLDPTSFTAALTNSPSLAGRSFAEALRGFLEAAGVDASPPNQVYYSDGRGLLMVKATRADLDRVAEALDSVVKSPQQVVIEARFVEAPEDFVKRIDAGTLVSSEDESNAVRVLTATQARAFEQQAKQTPGVDMLAAPRVTTLSGRQAQIQDAELKTILTGIDPRALSGTAGMADAGTNVSPFLTRQVPLGPSLDVTARLGDDGSTLQLTAIGSVTEFLGYEKATNTVRVLVNGKLQEVEPPLPLLRTRKTTGSALLYDGQSLLLIGPAVVATYRFVDKVPVLGDLPLVGRLFRSEGTSQSGRHVLVLITTTLIDPAGNVIHSADHLPFDPDTIPPQPR